MPKYYYVVPDRDKAEEFWALCKKNSSDDSVDDIMAFKELGPREIDGKTFVEVLITIQCPVLRVGIYDNLYNNIVHAMFEEKKEND